MIRWIHPRHGWVKLNIDRASKGNSGAAGGRGLIRGALGEVYGSFSINCGVCSSVKGALMAVAKGLHMAWLGGHRRVILSIDSEIVRRWLMEDETSTSPYFHLIRRCLAYISRVVVFMLKFA